MEKANNPYNLSPATLRALERFGPDKSSNRSSGNRLEPLPLPGADWELWAHMPKATLTEAVAVSLGIDPSAIKRGGGYAEPGIEFDRRLKLASAFVNDAGPLKPIGPLGALHLLGGPVTAVVSLPEFAKWALGMGWTLPERFPRFKAAPPPALTIHNPVVQDIMHAALQRVGQGSAQKPDTVPVVKPQPPTDLRAKRQTWRDATWPYVVKTFKAGQYKTAKDFYKALLSTAGQNESPFKKGSGQNIGSLFVDAIGKPLALKTVENAMAEIRKAAKSG